MDTLTTPAPAQPAAVTVTSAGGDLRRLVTVETIRDLRPIDGADAIEAATVRGWTVVVKKGEFTVGQDCVYLEIDSLLPLADDRFAFLAPRGTKTLPDGTLAHRLKTAKLRGTYSQGLVLPLTDFPEVAAAETLSPGTDHAGLLAVIKYEAPLPADADIIAEFPTHLATKTDSERTQNLADVWDTLLAAGPWLATEKIDGTSLTVSKDTDGDLHVCSRNYELARGGSLYWRAVTDNGLEDLLAPGDTLQGEIAGPGIQGNPLALNTVHLVVFTYTRDRVVLVREEWPAWVADPATAPGVRPVGVYDLELPDTAADAVTLVDGISSLLSPGRKTEGVVWHRANGEPLAALGGRPNFKTISNKYLLKHDS